MMKRTVILVTIALVASAIAAPEVLAHGRGSGYGRGIWGDRGRCPMSQPVASLPASLETQTVSGEIIRIERKMFGRGGIHIHIDNNGTMTEIHVGPAWYLDERGFNLEVGDRVEIRGFPISSFSEKMPALVAIEIHKGDEVLTLRDEAGIPLWRGQNRQEFNGMRRSGGWQ